MTRVDGFPTSIAAMLHPKLRQNRSEQTRYSHFEGTDEELKYATLAAWWNGKFEKSKEKPNCYFVDVSPRGFYSIADRGDRTPSGWHKRPADRARVIVELVKDHSQVASPVIGLILIDMQAFTKPAAVICIQGKKQQEEGVNVAAA